VVIRWGNVEIFGMTKIGKMGFVQFFFFSFHKIFLKLFREHTVLFVKKSKWTKSSSTPSTFHAVKELCSRITPFQSTFRLLREGVLSKLRLQVGKNVDPTTWEEVGLKKCRLKWGYSWTELFYRVKCWRGWRRLCSFTFFNKKNRVFSKKFQKYFMKRKKKKLYKSHLSNFCHSENFYVAPTNDHVLAPYFSLQKPNASHHHFIFLTFLFLLFPLLRITLLTMTLILGELRTSTKAQKQPLYCARFFHEITMPQNLTSDIFCDVLRIHNKLT
jgi:hypothetical protein